MKHILSRLRKYGFISLFGLMGLAPQVHAGSHNEPVDKYVNVEELKRLLEVARESGFSDEEIAKITIEREGKVINVLEFLKAYEARRKKMQARERAYNEKDYLTAQDIFSELNKTQPKDLSQLRDKTTYKE